LASWPVLSITLLHKAKNLLINKDTKIQQRIDMDLLSRSLTGIIVYAVMLPLVFWPFDFYILQPTLSKVFALSMLFISLLRVIHKLITQRLYLYSAKIWRSSFYFLSLCHAGVLSTFFVFAIYDQRFDSIIHVTMLAIGGISSGAVVALIPRIRFALTNLSVLLIPSIVAGIIINEKFPFAGMIALYLGFIAMIGVRSSREYIRSFEIESMLDEQKNELERQSKTDALTNIYNRGYFNIEFEKQWQYASRLNLQLSLLLVDVDHFKAFNDNYGHLFGDACLVHIAKIINQVGKRETDLAARFGGEEFVLLILENKYKEAAKVAEVLRQKIESSPFNVDGKFFPVTVSIGVASIQPSHKIDSRQLIEQADTALYKAKNAGRNLVMVHLD
jgi:diguanylate cyclase (GGDEF)-like protein